MKKNIKHFVFCLLLVAFQTTLFAQIPNGYYNNAEGKTGDALKIALHNIIKNHNVQSYSSLGDIYAYTDCYSDHMIWDIYSNKHWSLSNTCGNYDSEGDCWNKEHTWPQSWFNEKSGPKSDLFHVMPTDGYVNNRRSNYPYGEVNNPTWTSSNGSKLGSCSTAGYSGTVFEPVDEYKGDIARNFFYMSVRYYGEDSGWGTSGMTNKSVILDWAMTMLLRWSDADPVSQKEIDRNNAIYGYQNNRNPFIDHPEYARMIWDPNYTPADTYNITCATGLSHGSVSAPTTAAEGSTVAITATPDAGYMVSSYSAYKTGSPSTTVTVSSNGTFTMPAYDVTVSATFVVNNTYYAISTATVTHGSISVSTNSAKSGTTVTMTATPDSGYNLYSWYVYKTGDMNTSVYTGTTGSFVMPAFDVTVNATFSTQGSSAQGDFVKVTEALSDWSGDYLIVYETGNVAFDGGLTTLDANNNTINVTINNNTIEASQNNLAAKFTFAKSGNNYTIKSASGNYIGATSESNVVNTSTSTAYTNTISYNGGDIDIVGSGGPYLRYNTGNYRFRYYKSSTYTGQKAIQLYKRAVTVVTPTHTIHFNNNGGTGSMNDQTVDEFVPTALTPNTFTRDGYVFDGWNTVANGTGTYYADNANITLTDDITLYAQWDPKYNITLATVANGTISASVSSAVEGTTITLTASPATGYEFEAWNVTDGSNNPIDVVENQFEMPADHVTVSATFVAQSSTADAYYVKVTSAPTDWSGEYLIVCENKNVAFNGTIDNNWGKCSAVTISTDYTIESNATTDAYMVTISGNSTTGYQFLFPNGSYMNWTEAKKFSQGSTAKNYTISISNGDVSIAYGTVATLKYNYNNGNGGLRSYASGQTAIQLYKKTGDTPTPILTYTITFYPNEGTGNAYTQTVNENEVTTLTANTFTREGYNFNGWNTQADGNGTAYTDQQEVTLSADLDLYAQWTSQGGDETHSYNYYLVTSADQLVSGRTYLIVNLEAQKALGTTQNTNNRNSVSVTITDNAIESISNTVCELTLGGESGVWTLFDSINNGYLYAASSTANHLKTQATNDANGEWDISITSSGIATLTAQGSNTRNLLKYNSTNNPPIFSCYGSGQKDVSLFIRSEEFDHTANETVANLFWFDKHTVRNGITLTVSGTATCENPDQLILEEGAQLIHHNDGVQATMVKNITAYTNGETSDGWYTIALPMASVDPTQVESMTENSYDLYAYDEDAELEWVNHKNGGFNLIAGQGYLYAHNPGTTLEVKGTLNNGDSSQTANLSYANSNADIKGFNLLGNPTAHAINFTKTTNVSDGYYYLNNNDTWTYEPSNTVPTGRGFLVKANATGQSVTLNPQSKRGDSTVETQDFASLQIDVDGETAYVKLTDGVSMPLISFNGNHSSLYLKQGNTRYIMLVRNESESLDLNYEVHRLGTHTLTVKANKEQISYLHLIDRLTGADIDLLTNPTYRFVSKTNDYAERFSLVFSPAQNIDTESDDFAYIKDSVIVIPNMGTNAMLQVIDMADRIVLRRDGAGTLSTANLTPGVYVLRLVDGDQIKTQKIVLR